MTDNGEHLAGNSFLFVAHPGHELCVHAWLASVRPKVFVLTDGSGHSSQPRICSTTKLLEAVRAKPGSIYARFTDAELYALILHRQFEPLLRVVDEFAEAIVAEKPHAVAGDAIEGFNPAHDTCRLIINAAVAIARRRSPAEIINQDFLLVGRHTPRESAGATCLRLDDASFTRKLAAARAFVELTPEVDALLDGDLLAFHRYPQIGDELLRDRNIVGAEAYRVECLRLVDEEKPSREQFATAPFYEKYGELRVAAGYYGEVIRYRDHMVPLAEALSQHAGSS